ncbi:hypothetical protein QEH52_08485 [Coraliomargarita sp. SDUM461003]|uniref:PEP-CTERM protein-sorting domain-containing protein n=1 Tax=Thalassobacterium maritimum TaxID=3041265 RepID=A0ABU1ATZ1_9BACT|nr:hypothetical protein [Coraliomargarita sp. SDUM461003]MDQ8207543.1 hypothetical protein [Coraliomargarita sp. SDUM461003]
MNQITIASITLLTLSSISMIQAAPVTISGNQTLQGQTGVGELIATNNGAGNNATAIQLRNGYTLTIEDGAIVNLSSGINISQGVNGNGANLTMEVGSTLNVGSGLSMSGNATGGTSFITMEGGVLDVGGNFGAGSQYAASFTIEGDDATIDVGGNVNAYENSVFNFNLGTGGVSSIDAEGTMTITSGASLVVDGSAYSGSSSITLFQFATDSLTGIFDVADITLTELDGYSLVYGADSIYLAIPEPSSFVFGAGILAFGAVLLRRPRVS